MAHLRAIPNLNVFRPADTIETLECWETALKSSTNPSVIALSRQKLPYVSDNSSGGNRSSKGAYVLKKTSNNAHVSLIASGSEVEIALEAQEKLKVLNINSKVISVPCFDLFDKQSKDYKEQLLGANTFKISIEASSQTGWKHLVGKDGSYNGGIIAPGVNLSLEALYLATANLPVLLMIISADISIC